MTDKNKMAFRKGWTLLKRRPQPKPRKMFCGVCNDYMMWESEDESINQTGEWGEYRCTGCGISDDTHSAMHRYQMAGGI
jgi:transcription elongation factor Elf1